MDFGVWFGHFEFKLKNESVAFVIPVSFSTKEVEILSEEEVNHPDESNDEEKFRMVVNRMANAIRMESSSCITRRPKLSRTADTANSEWKMQRHFQRIMGSGVNDQRQEKHVAKKSCTESLKREPEVLVLVEEMK